MFRFTSFIALIVIVTGTGCRSAEETHEQRGCRLGGVGHCELERAQLCRVGLLDVLDQEGDGDNGYVRAELADGLAHRPRQPL